MRENANGITHSDANGATAMPSPTAALTRPDPDRDREREQEARGRLEEHQAAVQREPLVPGEPAPREVARGVREHADDEDPVQRARAVEDALLDLGPQRQRDDQEQRSRS